MYVRLFSIFFALTKFYINNPTERGPKIKLKAQWKKKKKASTTSLFWTRTLFTYPNAILELNAMQEGTKINSIFIQFIGLIISFNPLFLFVAVFFCTFFYSRSQWICTLDDILLSSKKNQSNRKMKKHRSHQKTNKQQI